MSGAPSEFPPRDAPHGNAPPPDKASSTSWMVTDGWKYAGVFSDSVSSGPATKRDWFIATRQQCVKFCPPTVPEKELVALVVRLASCGMSWPMLEYAMSTDYRCCWPWESNDIYSSSG